MLSGLTKTVTVFQFKIGDAEDPDLYAAEPLSNWERSDQGKWVKQHAVETPVWYRQLDPNYLGYMYAIRAKLYEKDLTYFYLKWGDKNDRYV